MSMAMKYGMMKRGGEACMAHGTRDCAPCKADGGMVEEEKESGYMPSPEPGADEGEEGIVDRIMKRFAKGGAVANDTPPMADSEKADFDVLPDMEDTEADYTGANAGDEVGNEEEDEEDNDIVGRVMKSWKKKDKMPRPA